MLELDLIGFVACTRGFGYFSGLQVCGTEATIAHQSENELTDSLP